MLKVVKLKKVEQENKTIKMFVQKFKRATRDSEYKGKLLVEEFKREMNEVIRRKLMKIEYPLKSIEQWYKRITNLDRYWGERRREEKRLRGRKKTRVPA